MDARGQVYFDLAEHIPEEDAKRLIDADADYEQRKELEGIHEEVTKLAMEHEKEILREKIRAEYRADWSRRFRKALEGEAERG